MLAANMIQQIANAYSINPAVLLTTLQKENSLLSKNSLASVATLNNAMGCGAVSTFEEQIECAAMTLTKTFKASVTYPYFFPVYTSEKACYPGCKVTHSIQYSFGTTECTASTHPKTCDLAGFWLANAATYTQYKYTPFVQTFSTGVYGGFRAFEQLWWNYEF